jgi:hypothetical protein
MTRRTFDDWKYLVDKQTASGLSVPKFCSQHNLNPKYFYSRKSMISTKSNEGGFIQAQVISHQTTVLTNKQEQSIKLITSAAQLQLPCHTSPAFIIELLNGLS